MKKTKLERFVRDNREQFDAFEPSAALWERINTQLPEEAVTQSMTKPLLARLLTAQVLKIAASVVLISAVSIFFFNQYQQKTNPEAVVAEVSPTDAKAVFQYASLIEQKRDELKAFETEDPHLYQEFASEIDHLNTEYEKLRTELPKSPNQEDVIQAMLQNLQSQVGILNQQLQIIQKIKQAKKSHENTI